MVKRRLEEVQRTVHSPTRTGNTTARAPSRGRARATLSLSLETRARLVENSVGVVCGFRTIESLEVSFPQSPMCHGHGECFRKSSETAFVARVEPSRDRPKSPRPVSTHSAVPHATRDVSHPDDPSGTRTQVLFYSPELSVGPVFLKDVCLYLRAAAHSRPNRSRILDSVLAKSGRRRVSGARTTESVFCGKAVRARASDRSGRNSGTGNEAEFRVESRNKCTRAALSCVGQVRARVRLEKRRERRATLQRLAAARQTRRQRRQGHIAHPLMGSSTL